MFHELEGEGTIVAIFGFFKIIYFLKAILPRQEKKPVDWPNESMLHVCRVNINLSANLNHHKTKMTGVCLACVIMSLLAESPSDHCLWPYWPGDSGSCSPKRNFFKHCTYSYIVVHRRLTWHLKINEWPEICKSFYAEEQGA